MIVWLTVVYCVVVGQPQEGAYTCKTLLACDTPSCHLRCAAPQCARVHARLPPYCTIVGGGFTVLKDDRWAILTIDGILGFTVFKNDRWAVARFWAAILTTTDGPDVD